MIPFGATLKINWQRPSRGQKFCSLIQKYISNTSACNVGYTFGEDRKALEGNLIRFQKVAASAIELILAAQIHFKNRNWRSDTLYERRNIRSE